MNSLTVIAVILGVAVLGAASYLAVVLVGRSLRRQATEQAAAERQATVEAVRALVADQGGTVEQAVKAVVEVAGDRLSAATDASRAELDLRERSIGTQVEAMSNDLRDLRQLLQNLSEDRVRQHGELSQALVDAAERHQALALTTQGLRDALSSTKARGQWGERTAYDLLGKFGFVEGVNFQKQTGIAGGGIPDVTFFLPERQLLHMDVKFPADNYLRSLEAPTETERDRLVAAFLRDVRDRVKELAARRYDEADNTVDFVLLFIPLESLYGFIHENDTSLIDFALGQKVILCSPSTLFGVLAVVRQAVDRFMAEQTSDQILACLTSFTGEWGKFVEQMDKVEKQLKTVSGSFESLTSTRKNQLDRELRRIDDLRVQRGLPEPPDEVGELHVLREVGAG
jgi:DNA recombination protein RmuC